MEKREDLVITAEIHYTPGGPSLESCMADVLSAHLAGDGEREDGP